MTAERPQVVDHPALVDRQHPHLPHFRRGWADHYTGYDRPNAHPAASAGWDASAAGEPSFPASWNAYRAALPEAG